MFFKKLARGFIRRPVILVICSLLLVSASYLALLGKETGQAANSVVLRESEIFDIAMPVVPLATNGKLGPRNIRDLNENVEATLEKTGKLLFPTAIRMEQQEIGGAYASELNPVYLEDGGVFSEVFYNSTQDLAVFVVQCMDVAESEYQDINKKRTFKYTYECQVKEAVCLNRLKSVPEKIFVTDDDTHTQEPFMEPGKTYLAWGTYDDSEGTLGIVYAVNRWRGVSPIREQNGKHLLKDTVGGKKQYVPVMSELNEPLSSFLQTEMGKLWQETVIDRVNVSAKTLSIVGTNNMGYIYAFNMGGCTFSSGEAFTQEQSDNGERVCVISEELAELNGLQVGSVISMKTFNVGYPYIKMSSLVYLSDFYDNYKGFTGEGEWRVVGIYHTDYEKLGYYAIHPNVVFVPKKSLDGKFTNYPNTSCNMRNVFVIPEGSVDDFRKDAAAAGYKGWFIYGDGRRAELEAERVGLHEARDAWVADLQKDAAWLSKLSLVLCLIPIPLFLLTKKEEIGKLYSIETTRRTLFLHFMMQGVLMGAVTCGISFLLDRFVLPGVTERLLRTAADPQFADVLMESLTTEPVDFLPTFGKQALLLFAIALIVSAVCALRKYHFYYHEEGGEANSDRL